MCLRLGVGGMLLGVHGWARLMTASGYLFAGKPWPFIGVVTRMGFPMPAAFAVASALAESIGSILLVLGLGTRWAALVVGFNMAVATYLQLSKGGGTVELPAMYLIGIVAIAIAGAGAYSLDARRGGRRGRR